MINAAPKSGPRATLAALALVSAAGVATSCGGSTPLPKAANFRGPDCQAVAAPVVQVAAATRKLAEKPAAAGAVTSIAAAQQQLRALPARTTAALPEVSSLITQIGVFRLRVDTHSADDNALRDVMGADTSVVRRCGAG